MPSPVGHSLSGVLSYLTAVDRKRNGVGLLALFVLVTILPDFDFLPGWIIGQPNLFHRGASHSLCVALLIGLLVGLVAMVTGKGKFVPMAVIGFLMYTLHIVLDLFSVDYSVPRGFPVLWPFDRRCYIAPVEVFLNITRSGSSGEFFTSLFNSHNLEAVINELIIFLPPTLLMWGLRWRGRASTRPFVGRAAPSRKGVGEVGGSSD
jgi:inner membrane protein